MNRLLRVSFLTMLAGLGGSPAFGATFLSFSAGTYGVQESGSNATISVLRAGNPHAKTTLNYATSNGTVAAGSDYTATAGTLTFNSKQRLKNLHRAYTQ